MGPADTPREAVHRMINTKKLSSKINYSVLDNLFDAQTYALTPCFPGLATSSGPVTCDWLAFVKAAT